MRLLLVRHGQSEWNADKRLQGQADIALSGKGIRQAQTLAATINRLAPAHVLTSDLKRARHTAELLGYPDAEAGSGLREVHVGDWQGQRIADIIAADEARYLGWRAGTHTPPNGENWAQFVARTSSTIEAQREKHAGQTILAVCHGGVIRALLDHYLGLAPSHIIPVGPASLTVLLLPDKREKSARLELFNYRPVELEFDAPD